MTNLEQKESKIMKLLVDGEVKDYPQGISLKEWMELDEVCNPEVAVVYVNDRHILATDMECTTLHEGDRIQLLYFLGDS